MKQNPYYDPNESKSTWLLRTLPCFTYGALLSSGVVAILIRGAFLPHQDVEQHKVAHTSEQSMHSDMVPEIIRHLHI